MDQKTDHTTEVTVAAKGRVFGFRSELGLAFSPCSKAQNASINELEGYKRNEAELKIDGLIGRVARARAKPVQDLTLEELHTLLTQQVDLEHVVPKAIDIVRVSPLADAGTDSADLLKALLRLPLEYWEAEARRGQWCLLQELVSDIIGTSRVLEQLYTDRFHEAAI